VHIGVMRKARGAAAFDNDVKRCAAMRRLSNRPTTCGAFNAQLIKIRARGFTVKQM
jgi:hypothetical protein